MPEYPSLNASSMAHLTPVKILSCEPHTPVR